MLFRERRKDMGAWEGREMNVGCSPVKNLNCTQALARFCMVFGFFDNNGRLAFDLMIAAFVFASRH